MKYLWLVALGSLTAVGPASAREPLALTQTHDARPQASLLLELDGWHCFWNNRQTIEVEGKVKNVSSIVVQKVTAYIVVNGEDGKPVADGRKRVDDEKLAPRTTSAFAGEIVLKDDATSARPKSCDINFEDGDGTHLNWRASN